jgi:hypothetical protein
MEQTELALHIQAHEQWLNNPNLGKKMDVRGRNIANADFSNTSLFGANLSHCDLTSVRLSPNCHGANFVATKGSPNFKGVDVSDTTFEKAQQTVIDGLIGAIWHNQVIRRVSQWDLSGYYDWFKTDAFVQIGCMQKTLNDWLNLGQTCTTLIALHDDQPKIDLDATWSWWCSAKDSIISK